MTSISTFARSSISALTSTAVIAALYTPIISRKTTPISRLPCEVLALVGQIPRHARDVLGSPARFGEHGDDVRQRLANLAHQIVA